MFLQGKFHRQKYQNAIRTTAIAFWIEWVDHLDADSGPSDACGF